MGLAAQIVAGLRRRQPAIDVAAAYEHRLRSLPDREVLIAARSLDRILLTHDRKTMPGRFQRIMSGRLAGEHSPGMIWLNQLLPIGRAIEAILLV